MDDRLVDASGHELSRRTVVRGVGGGTAAAALAVLGLRVSARPVAAQEEAVRDAWAAAWSSGSGEEVAAVFTDDGTYEDVPYATVVQGTADITAYAQAYFDTMADVTQTVDNWLATTTWAVAEWSVVGTHAATGNPLTFRGASVLELADGKIARESAYYDNATFITQTGGTCEAAAMMPEGTPEGTPET